MQINLVRPFDYQRMGNTSESKEQIKDIDHTHERLRTSGKLSRDGRTFIEAYFSLLNQQYYDGWKQNLNRDPCLETPNAFLPVETSVSSDGICGKTYMAKGIYPNFSYVLADELKNRKKINNKSSEQQLWSLIYSLSRVASRYHRAGKQVGDIRPQNIFFNENAEIKVATQDSWPQEQTNYWKSLKLDEKAYLSPEQVIDVAMGKLASDLNMETNQSFSIGLSALDLALLESSEELYHKKGSIDISKLNEKKRRLMEDKELSLLLKSTILNLLEENQYDRLTPTDIQKWLSINKVQILNLHPFSVTENQIPKQIKNTVERRNVKSKIPAKTENIAVVKQTVNVESQLPQKLEEDQTKLQSGVPLTSTVQHNNYSKNGEKEKIRETVQKILSTCNPPPESFTKEVFQRQYRESLPQNIQATLKNMQSTKKQTFRPGEYVPPAPQRLESKPEIRKQEDNRRSERYVPLPPSAFPDIPFRSDRSTSNRQQTNSSPQRTQQRPNQPSSTITFSQNTHHMENKPIVSSQYIKQNLPHSDSHKIITKNSVKQQASLINNSISQYRPLVNNSTAYDPVRNGDNTNKQESMEESAISQEPEYKMDFIPHLPRPSLREVVTKSGHQQNQNKSTVAGGQAYNFVSRQPRFSDRRESKQMSHSTERRERSSSKNIYNEKQIEQKMNRQVKQVIPHPL